MTAGELEPRGGTAPSFGSRLPGIEGLRALAALSVLGFHVYWFGGSERPTASLGGLGRNLLEDLHYGLMLFFVLSGFLLYRPFAAAVTRARPFPSVRAYLRNRALRILPAYWVILLATVFVLQTAQGRLGSGSGASVRTLAADLLLVQNYSLETLFTGIGPAWSLDIEVVFYLVLPALGLVGWALGRRARGSVGGMAAILAPAAILLAFGLASRVAIAFFGPELGSYAALARISFAAHADLFALGMLAAAVQVAARDGRISVSAATRRAMAAAALAAIVAVIVVAPRSADFPGNGWDVAVGAASALVILLCCLPSARRSAGVRVLELRPLVWVGLCSYSVYLWHQPVVLLLRKWGLTWHDPASFVLVGAAVLAVTLALSALTYRLVERPALARRKHTERSHRAEQDAVAPGTGAFGRRRGTVTRAPRALYHRVHKGTDRGVS